MSTSESKPRPLGGSPVKFTLIVATVERTHQLTRLLESLKHQSCRDFEVIVVDQNPPGFLDGLLAPYSGCFPILHLRSEIGLSRARNVGLRHIGGQVVAFPDDDCWYPPDALERIDAWLAEHPEWGGVTVRPSDPQEPHGFAWYHRASGPLDWMNLWRRAISFTTFLRREVVWAVGGFDEALGLGTATGMLSAEESEYLIRVLQHGFSVHYCLETCVYHPALPPGDEPRIERALGEGRAFGYVLRKYRYPLPFVIRTWIRALGGAVRSLLRGEWNWTLYYLALFRGRLRGWLIDSRRNAHVAAKSAAGEIPCQEHHAE